VISEAFYCVSEDSSAMTVSDRGDALAFEITRGSPVLLDRKDVKKLRRDLKHWLKLQKERER
jgi:hypothetical protein